MAKRTAVPVQWRVLPGDPTDRRTHFNGTEDDARKYVEQNFPRAHGSGFDDDPQPDVYVVSPEGIKHSFHAENGWHDHSEDIDDEDEDDDTDDYDSQRVADLRILADSRDIDSAGNKSTIIQRLRDADNAERADADED